MTSIGQSIGGLFTKTDGGSGKGENLLFDGHDIHNSKSVGNHFFCIDLFLLRIITWCDKRHKSIFLSHLRKSLFSSLTNLVVSTVDIFSSKP